MHAGRLVWVRQRVDEGGGRCDVPAPGTRLLVPISACGGRTGSSGDRGNDEDHEHKLGQRNSKQSHMYAIGLRDSVLEL
jgi:hypothetical protein